MNTVVELTGVALAALLAENFVLVSCMDIGTHTRAFEDPIDSLRTGYCLTVVMVLGTFFTWCIDNWIFANHRGQHFRLFVFALLIPAMVWLLRKFLLHCVPELSRRIDEHLASISTNCAALGCALLVSQRSYDLITALTFALFGGVGVTVALTSFTNLMGEANLKHCPECFRGVPITLVAASIVALAFFGFAGVVENLLAV